MYSLIMISVINIKRTGTFDNRDCLREPLIIIIMMMINIK